MTKNGKLIDPLKHTSPSANPVKTEEMEQFFGAMGRLGRKDLDCALATAADKGVALPTAEYVRDRIENVFLAKDESRPVD